MTRSDQIRTLIYRAIDRVNDAQQGEPVAKSPATVLMGEAPALDSMGFVTFMAALEDGLFAMTGREISIVDVMFADEADVWTVETLARHLADLTAESAASSSSPVEAPSASTIVGFPRAERNRL